MGRAERKGTATIGQDRPSAALRTNWCEPGGYEVTCGRARRAARYRSRKGMFARAAQRRSDAPFASSRQGIAAVDRERPNSSPNNKRRRRNRPECSPKTGTKAAPTNSRGRRTRNRQSPATGRSSPSGTPKTGFCYATAACNSSFMPITIFDSDTIPRDRRAELEARRRRRQASEQAV